ncbi:MAG: hypothetical protein JWO96_358 [Candidatus Saccharibacteria bacterium]|nr:hypothetical protein [Candidatus Saccharibacteria bacterium]
MTRAIQVIVDVLALSWLLIGAAHIIGSSIYDFRHVRRIKLLRDSPSSKPLRLRPLVSVVMAVSHPAASDIEKSVRALAAGRYRKLEVIIVSSQTSGTVQRKINDLTRAYPSKIKRSIRPAAMSMSSAINRAIIRSCSGNLVMVLTPDDVVDKNAVRSAVDRLSLNENADAAGLNLSGRPNHRLSGLLDLFSKLARGQINKFYDIIGRQKGLSEAVLYRRGALLSRFDHSRRDRFHYIFVSDARVEVEPPASAAAAFRRFYSCQLVKSPYLAIYPMMLKFALPSMFTFFLYEAIYLQNTFLLGLGWATFSAYLIFSILSDENLKLRQKIGMCLIAPAMFGPFILLSLVIATASLELFLTTLGENTASLYRFVQSKVKPAHLRRV